MALIHSGTRRSQRVVAGTVNTIVVLASQADLRSPVTIVVGAVVDLAERLDWFHSIASPAIGARDLAREPLDVASWHV